MSLNCTHLAGRKSNISNFKGYSFYGILLDFYFSLVPGKKMDVVLSFLFAMDTPIVHSITE